ncbi:IclR family transcriptional regulator C-terminal domain-containing protein [Corynebacterium sp.]|uniref:IclR family transcriptional regulator domain-containing protein n=1 Tax=Corynebacterium sp. TaxID=1720 RepID=UPI0028B191AA|nr:IclR family transcriptional regulator C-terminal domain-containing protein [Corynebacterium sp.]
MTSPSSDFVQSFARGLMVIRSFDAAAPSQTLSQVAGSTGLSRAAARRFLHTLVEEGYAVNNDGQFTLTPRVLELGYSYLSALTLPALAQPRLESLSAQVGESCSMSVLDGTDIHYVSRVAVRKIMTVNITIGTRFPAHSTSMGRVLLAGMPDAEIRSFLEAVPLEHGLTPRSLTDKEQLFEEIIAVRNQGWALVDQELELGLRSLAAPITDANGKIVAAINISTQSAVSSVNELTGNYLPVLLSTASEISRDLVMASN